MAFGRSVQLLSAATCALQQIIHSFNFQVAWAKASHLFIDHLVSCMVYYPSENEGDTMFDPLAICEVAADPQICPAPFFWSCPNTVCLSSSLSCHYSNVVKMVDMLGQTDFLFTDCIKPQRMITANKVKISAWQGQMHKIMFWRCLLGDEPDLRTIIRSIRSRCTVSRLWTFKVIPLSAHCGIVLLIQLIMNTTMHACAQRREITISSEICKI